MRKFRLPRDLVARYCAYLSSPEYRAVPAHAKSDYWEYHAALIDVRVDGDEIAVSGQSGCYIPPGVDWPARARTMLGTLRRTLDPRRPRFLSVAAAFDAVMSHHPVADVDLSAARLDFLKLRSVPGVVCTTRELRRRFFARHRYQLSAHLVRAYYLLNVLLGHGAASEVRTVLEIGGGNGNLAAVLRHRLGARMVLVDLPETLAVAIPFLADLFPDSSMVLPNEVARAGAAGGDFVFLTPAQTAEVADASIDLAVNVSSFQEMTSEQIGEYFTMVQRVCRDGALFLVHNRVEKLPLRTKTSGRAVAVNRFAEFPWNPRNEVLVYEVCRLARLVQADDDYLRLERVRR